MAGAGAWYSTFARGGDRGPRGHRLHPMWQNWTAPLVARPFSLVLAGAVVAASWAWLWTVDSTWNPLAFTTLWVGAAVVMYRLGPLGYPGVRVHALLAASSIPLWWWFELANARVENWTYLGAKQYETVAYVVLTSIAFSTVVPALHSAWRLTGARSAPPMATPPARGARTRLAAFGAAALAMQALVIVWPTVFYPLVWVAPFVALDAVVHYLTGASLAADLAARRWGLAFRIAAGGLLCGFLWELWNFRASPSWVYDVPGFDWGHVFAMPIAGYGGYVPFVLSVYQLVQLGRLALPGRTGALAAAGID